MLSLLRAALLSLGCVGAAWAQSAPEAASAPAAAPAVESAAPASTPATAAAPAMPGVKSANIFEIGPDAAADPGYANQTNGERNRVQPGNNAPMWRAVGGGVTGYSSLPKSEAPEAGNLIQPMVQYPGSRFTSAGEAWRQVRNHWLLPYGAALLGIVVLALAILFFTSGPLGHKEPKDTARPIERFTPFERAAHWVNAAAFVALAISGLTMAFGKFFLQPVLGLHLAGWLTYALKYVHNFVGPAFAVSLLVVILTFIKDNFASLADFTWLRKLGGMFSHEQVPSHRFNAGEKGIFWWAVTIPGLIVVASGLVLNKLVPGLEYLRGDMQIAHMIHLTAGLFMMALMIGHIYMGTVGMYGAYSAMKTGYVSEEWAREHHQLWYDDIVAGKIPAQRSGQSAPDPVPPTPAGSTT
ncbi:formate dehydrogenase subunit gamma [Ottowia sp. GY511]|uniref:Formate dehydrogenase subunit gamma n=1 Tax=Ottowia flava TaxID=2675430 RepID=A0ABW4KQM8_9BURK|nr:formate dehydrogenase subunit gamma [Ottowia sp. GY511]TXK26399.1 formate dehydrogenase subunit gamma [Ottowia sp. GY511]